MKYLSLKDIIALYLIKIVYKLGYSFHTRRFIDNPDFNGNDIAMFFRQTINEKGDVIYKEKTIGIVAGARNCERIDGIMIGKISG